MPKRLSIIAVIMQIVVTVVAPRMPLAVAMPANAGRGVPCDIMQMMQAMPMPADASELPCQGMIPACAGSFGCAVVALPSSAAVPTGPDWAPVVYPPQSSTLTGRSVDPEIFPPIIPF